MPNGCRNFSTNTSVLHLEPVWHLQRRAFWAMHHVWPVIHGLRRERRRQIIRRQHPAHARRVRAPIAQRVRARPQRLLHVRRPRRQRRRQNSRDRCQRYFLIGLFIHSDSKLP
jgi:hypothetical protein